MASLKRRLKSGSLNPYQQIHIWQHPWANKAAIGKEIDDAFAKKHPQEWADMQARLQNEINTAQENSSPDLGNSVQGDLSGISELNFSVTISRDKICHNRQEARSMVDRKGKPLHLENKFLSIEAVFNSKSEGKFADKQSIGRTYGALQNERLSDNDIKTIHYTAYGNVEKLFANAERMKFERPYKKQNVRKGFLSVYSPFEIEGFDSNEYVARIELELHQEKGKKPTAYLLNVSIEKRPLFLGRRGASAEPFDKTEITSIQADFPDIVKSQNSTSNIQNSTSVDFSLAELHASAHNFRKFDTSYMGTGEGAQAYGWGLYFAAPPRQPHLLPPIQQRTYHSRLPTRRQPYPRSCADTQILHFFRG